MISLWILTFSSLLLLLVWVYLDNKFIWTYLKSKLVKIYLEHKSLFSLSRQSLPEKYLNGKKKKNCDFIMKNIELLKAESNKVRKQEQEQEQEHKNENPFSGKQIETQKKKISHNNLIFHINDLQWENNDDSFEKQEEIENKKKEEIIQENIYFQKKEQPNQLFQEKKTIRKIKTLEKKESAEKKKILFVQSPPLEKEKPIQINHEESLIFKKDIENITFETPKKFPEKIPEKLFQNPLQILDANSSGKIFEKPSDKVIKTQENILNPSPIVLKEEKKNIDPNSSGKIINDKVIKTQENILNPSPIVIKEEKKNIPMQLEFENPVSLPEPKLIKQEQIPNKIEVKSFFLQNKKKIQNINKFFQDNENKISPTVKEEMEGTIRKAIGQLYGNSLIRLYETSEELIILSERFKNKENLIFFAHQLVKMTLKNQISNFFSQSEDKSTMRDRVARIAILFHLINLHCPCLIDFCMLIINEEIPLLGNITDQPVKKDKSPSYFYNKIEAYSYLYFCILALDLQNFYSEENLSEMKRKLPQDEEPNFIFSQKKLKNFFNSQKKINNYNEFYWEFVKTFFKLPICEVKVVITISFCYASYFIWKKEKMNIIKIIQKINDKYLPLLKDFQAKIKDKNEQNKFRLNYGRLEEIVEIICNQKQIPSFEEQKDDD